ncbi:MAG: hypothetical protein LBQ50_11670 [Planctomycetaceae bacterium]|nr:hypothetical protein [Planctomycetaceae bacterium]
MNGCKKLKQIVTQQGDEITINFSHFYHVLSEDKRKIIAIEVGMQNGGLASALAIQLGKDATMGLASAICSPLMNITGAALAIWWQKKSEQQEIK